MFGCFEVQSTKSLKQVTFSQAEVCRGTEKSEQKHRSRTLFHKNSGELHSDFKSNCFLCFSLSVWVVSSCQQAGVSDMLDRAHLDLELNRCPLPAERNNQRQSHAIACF